jgi:hypothetical protein
MRGTQAGRGERRSPAFPPPGTSTAETRPAWLIHPHRLPLVADPESAVAPRDGHLAVHCAVMSPPGGRGLEPSFPLPSCSVHLDLPALRLHYGPRLGTAAVFAEALPIR